MSPIAELEPSSFALARWLMKATLLLLREQGPRPDRPVVGRARNGWSATALRGGRCPKITPGGGLEHVSAPISAGTPRITMFATVSGIAFVHDSMMMRGAIQAVFWLSPPDHAYKVVAILDAAFDRANAKLHEASIAV